MKSGGSYHLRISESVGMRRVYEYSSEREQSRLKVNS